MKSRIFICVAALQIFWLGKGFSQASDFLSNLSDYIENTDMFELGQEEGRSFYIPDQHLLLNGSWKFYYSDVPEGIPGDFFKEEFDDSDWSWIKVPSNWEMLGFGDRMFRNISTTFEIGRPATAPAGRMNRMLSPWQKSDFEVIPPEVPDEYNPTGAYRTTFDLPSGWEGKEVFLRFEKVASASFVWVNGKEAGYNEGAQEPAEYNITPYLKEGENTIAVFVVKFSDGYYLEGQDYWRLAGIFDDVWVYASPQVRLFDWQVITDLDEQFENAELSVMVHVKGYKEGGDHFTVHSVLSKGSETLKSLESEAFDVEEGGVQTITLEAHVEKPELWTSETPVLYDLTLELLDGNGEPVDRIDTRIGFKETEIKGNTFYLNGVPVKIHGINSHMQHPEQGHVMDEATIRKDFAILKQFNFNAVRTSHYPPVNKYLELADEYGIYIIDEAGTEAHASEYMSSMPEYTGMYRERVHRMVLRDRNHPSILFWSAGNESGEGENITEVIKEGKRLDPTRYWMYGGNADVHPAEDIIGPRYPSPIELEVNIGLDTEDTRPSFMDEYLAITGNGGGGLDDYWRVIYTHPRLMAGAIWDFVSTGITEPVRRLEDGSPYGTPVHIMGNARLVEGRDGNGIDLNGHDQWVEVYRADNVEITGNELTLVLDVFPRSLVSSSGSFLTKGDYQFGLQQKGKDSIDFYLFNGRKQTLTAPLPGNWENNWHRLMGTYDGEAMTLFIDGVERASMNATGEIQNLPFPVNVGRNVQRHGQDTDVYLCDAIIDNLGIFNHVIDPGSVPDPSASALWLGFEQESVEGSFYSYGIGARTYGAIWPDRTPQPEMWQMKKSAQPLSFQILDAESGLLEVWNRSNFTNASHWKTAWTLTEDAQVLQSGNLELDLPARERGEIRIPYTRPDIQPGKEYRLNISSSLPRDEPWADAGFEISWDQFELVDWFTPDNEPADDPGPVTLEHTNEAFVVSGEGFSYRFHRKSGALSSMEVGGQEMLASPLNLNVWRAPLANETDQWNGITMRSSRWKEGYDMTIATDYYSNGIHDLKQIPLEVRAAEHGGKVYIYVRELALTDGGAKTVTRMDMYISGRTLSGFESIYEYAVSGDGKVEISHSVLPQGSMPQMLPRVGVTLMLDESLDQVEWYGRGPQENYPDRKSGYRLGIYTSTVRDMFEPYLIPQDYGLRTDNRWVRMTSTEGKGLEFRMDQLFNFNAYPFTTENLTRALYPYQLREADGITLNLDYQTTGVGGTARPVLDAYRVFPEGYNRKITIKPIE
jgi:beta-galactosidase